MIVTGRVQGVFFRASARSKALELGLKGHARNMPNGSVEVVAQGTQESISEFVDFLRQSPGASKVEGVKVCHKEPENFKDFRIL